MTILTLNRFLSATAFSVPEATYQAPITLSDDCGIDYDFLTLLNTFAEHQRDGEFEDYFSFSNWCGGHSQWHHEGTTCLTLEYKSPKANEVREALAELEYAYYEIPTKSHNNGAILFVLPLERELDHTDTTRAASLIAESIGATGLVKNSFLYTYFFRFRGGGDHVAFTPGKVVPARLVGWANEHRIITDLKKFIR